MTGSGSASGISVQPRTIACAPFAARWRANATNAFLASAQVPQLIALFFVGSELSRWLILAGMLLLYLLLGTVMDSLAMIFLTVPIFIPIILGLDFGSLLAQSLRSSLIFCSRRAEKNWCL